MVLVNKKHLLFIMTLIALEICGLNLHYYRLSKQVLYYFDFTGAHFGKGMAKVRLKLKMAKHLCISYIL
jgi:hypothetical protein